MYYLFYLIASLTLVSALIGLLLLLAKAGFKKMEDEIERMI